MPIHPVYGHYENGWKVIPDFSTYEVNEFSQVRHVEHKQFLKENADYRVNLYKNGKRYTRFIYHLSLETFFPQVLRDNRTADHIKENDRTNNHIDNLQWLTQKEQLTKSHKEQPRNSRHKQSKPVEQWSLDGKTKIAEFTSASAVRSKLNISSADIGKCASGKRNTCAGYVWKYKHDLTQDCLEGEEFKTSENLQKLLSRIRRSGKPLCDKAISTIKVSNKGRILTAQNIKTKGNKNKTNRMFYGVSVAQMIWSVFGDRPPKIHEDGEQECVCHDLSLPVDEDGCYSDNIEHLHLDTRKNVAIRERELRKSKSILKKRNHSEIENN